MILHEDARIWRRAVELDETTQRQQLREEQEQGELPQSDYWILIERLGLVSNQDIPALLNCLPHDSQDLVQKARRLLGSFDPVIVVGHCLLALRDDRADAISLIDFLADMGADARFARRELELRLESWGCPLEERGALTSALSEIPESDSAVPMAASLNHKEAA